MPAASPVVCGHTTPPLAANEIERADAPSREEFSQDYLQPRRPVILRGLTAGWRPAHEWTFAGMAERYGSARVVAAVLAGGTLFEDAAAGVVFEHVSLGEFVENARRPGPATHYVMAPTWNLPPSFERDYRVPPYCEGAPHLRAKLWLGKAGTVTPTHRDVPNNLYVHLTGRKRWLLFPPGHCRSMYPRGPFSGMPNFARVDPENPDYERFPRFRAVPVFKATVSAGETLFIPRGWWHHARTIEDAVSMNFWWGGAWIYLAAIASAAFKRLRRISRDEWG